jgi:hypothetical protein
MRSGNLVEGDEAETKALITVCLVKIVKSRRFAHILCFATFVQRLSTRCHLSVAESPERKLGNHNSRHRPRAKYNQSDPNRIPVITA